MFEDDGLDGKMYPDNLEYEDVSLSTPWRCVSIVEMHVASNTAENTWECDLQASTLDTACDLMILIVVLLCRSEDWMKDLQTQRLKRSSPSIGVTKRLSNRPVTGPFCS